MSVAAPPGGMDRRLLLGLAGVVLLAGLGGCSAAGSLSMEPVTDAELAERASLELPTGERPGPDRAVARRAVANGTAETVATRPPVEGDRVYRANGSFYRLSVTVVGTEPGQAVGYLLDGNVSAADAEREGWTVVALEDLPAADREALGPLLERTPPDSDRERVGVRQVYRADEIGDSRLASGTVDAVRYRGELYRVTVTEREDQQLQVYRYEATTVAESAAAYGQQLREGYAFELSGLSEGEQRIVEAAIDGSYYAETDDDQAFAALVDRFRAHEGVVEDEYGGSYVVRYEGQLYWVRLDHSGFEG